MDAGQYVREARLRAGMTQRTVAVRAGVSQPLVARIELGKVSPSFDRLLQLVRACGFDLEIHVVPLDEDAWTLVEHGATISPDARLDRMLASERLLEESRGNGDEGHGEFQPGEILRTLDRYAVRYVVVGGLAAVLHGAAHVTTDVDVVPEEGRRNLERLSRALSDLAARIRVSGEPEGVPFGHSAESLPRVRVWNLTTQYGDLDITFVPSGTRGYDDLRRDAAPKTVRGVTVQVASLADVIRSKEAAGRTRDRAVLPGLRELLALQRRDRSGQPDSPDGDLSASQLGVRGIPPP